MANYLPATYNPSWGYSGVGQQMYPNYQQQSMAQQPQQTPQTGQGLIWVDGEVGAKAYQLPANLPPNQPIALWDTNDTVIYLKSVNPMGMPNPLQKAHYRLEEYKTANPGQIGDTGPNMSDYVRKDDMDRMKQELMDAISTVNTAGKRTTAKEA